MGGEILAGLLLDEAGEVLLAQLELIGDRGQAEAAVGIVFLYKAEDEPGTFAGLFALTERDAAAQLDALLLHQVELQKR